MRLDKYLSQATGFSRKAIKQMLHHEEVQVNGSIEKNPARKITQSDSVLLAGAAIDPPEDRYLMLHKPQGYVCSHQEADQATVFGLIDLPRLEKLTIAGRLDIDTTGLVLLSDDGQWCHRITSPRHKLGKVYEAELAAPIEPHYVQAFNQGIQLQSETELTKPAKLEILDERLARVTLFEGRYHQVKRMFSALSNRVVSLHREAIGPLTLDTNLAEGEWRILTQTEIETLYAKH